MKKIGIILIFTFLFLFNSSFAFSDETSTSSASISSIPDCVNNNISVADCPSYLQNKSSELKSQKQTLSSQIAVVNNQINLTLARIEATQEQITSLILDIDTASKKVSGLEQSLTNLVGVLANRITATYEVGTIQPFQILLTSNNASDFFKRLNYLKIAQAHDKKLVYDTQQAKIDYANQKVIFEDKKKKVEVLKAQLQDYTDQLNQEKATKQQLLQETQVHLDRINAEISALANFARSRIGPGGQSIPHQDLSDGWGKYYNQRDSNWGNNFIGLSNMQIWEVGCLLTSYAMVVTHYGGSIIPSEVAANSGNFSGGTAFFNLPGPSANGHSARDVSYPSLDDLRTYVKSGNAVIAGLSYDGGSIADHWVVIRSVNDDGSFMINDPLYAGAINVPLNDHYSGLKIVEARVYN